MKMTIAIATLTLTTVASLSAMAQQTTSFGCGVAMETGNHATWSNGYQAWTRINNLGDIAVSEFTVLLDVDKGRVIEHFEAEFATVIKGYQVTQPSGEQWQPIPQGRHHTFAYIGKGAVSDVTPYLISVNGETCDKVAPTVSLKSSTERLTTEGSLKLTSTAWDNVAVRKVVFEHNGEVLGEDFDAPYELTLNIAASHNGQHDFVAIAYDPTGNSISSEQSRVLVAIDERTPKDEAEIADALIGEASAW